MRSFEFVVVVVLLGALAIWTVREQARAVALGYEQGRLLERREELRRAAAELRYQRARLATPARLERVAQEYGLDLFEPAKAADRHAPDAEGDWDDPALPLRPGERPGEGARPAGDTSPALADQRRVR